MLGICPKGKKRAFELQERPWHKFVKNTLLMNITKFIRGGDLFFANHENLYK
jgi:hypothetical protein